eukprot:gene7617-8225_t
MKYYLPPKLVHNLYFSIRITWTVAIILVLQHYSPWTPYLVYVSPVICVICPSRSLGHWQENAVKVGYSTLLAASLGIGIGQSPNREVLWITIFLGMFLFNCISTWDRLTKVMATLALLVASLLPSITTPPASPKDSFLYVLAMLNIPSLLWGFTILFPSPVFACNQMKSHIISICNKLTAMNDSLAKAFLSYDSTDLHCAEFDQLLIEVIHEKQQLKQIHKHIENEVLLLFPHLKHLPEMVTCLMKNIDLMIHEYQSMRENITNILGNVTQFYFVKVLRPLLINIHNEIELLLLLAAEEFQLFSFSCSFVFSPASVSCLSSEEILNHPRVQFIETKKEKMRSGNIMTCFSGEMMFERSSASTTEREEGAPELFHYSFKGINEEEHEKLLRSDGKLNHLQEYFRLNPRLPTEDYLRYYLHQEYRESLKVLMTLRSQVFLRYYEIRSKYISPFDNTTTLKNTEIENSESAQHDYIHHFSMDEKTLNDSLENDGWIKHRLREETQRYSIRNFGARSSFLHGVSVVIENLSTLQTIFGSTVPSLSLTDYLNHYLFNIQSLISTLLFAFMNHIRGSVYEIMTLCMIFLRLPPCLNSFTSIPRNFSPLTTSTANTNTSYSSSDWNLLTLTFKKNIQPFKISLAVAIAAIIPIFNVFPTLLQKGLWSTFVCIIIRQDNLSSSFQTAYQRLEGTVIGSIYAFIVYQIFPCNDDRTDGYCIDQIYMQLSVLVGWLFFCGLFREGEQHGYAATVAGFTPLVLLLNPATSGQPGTMSRIEETFIGIVIYCLVDFCIFPRRIYPLIKQSTLASIKIMKDVIHDNIIAVEKIIKFDNITITPSPGNRRKIETSSDKKSSIFRISELTLAPEVAGLSKLSEDDEINSNNEGDVREGGIDVEMGTIVSHLPLSDIIPSTHHLPDRLRNEIGKIYEQCNQSILTSEKHLHVLHDELLKQSLYLKTILFEPNMFFYTFPWSSYDQLYQKFYHIYRSSCTLKNACKSLIIVICQMLEKDENIHIYLQHLSFLIQHVVEVTNKSDAALTLTYEAFQRLYDDHDENISLESLLTLRRSCDQLREATEEHFRIVYVRKPFVVISSFNPYFLTALLNLFESMIQVINGLSELGMVLHMVRNIEASQFRIKSP